MKTILSSKRNHYLARVTILLILVALIAGMVGCGSGGGGGGSYTLTIDSTAGGVVAVNNVTIPGKTMFTYDPGTVVSLNATPDVGYHFVNWTGNVSTIANVTATTTTVIMTENYSITANFEQLTPTQYSLSVAVAPAGNGTATDLTNASPYPAGTVVNIQAVAAAGYRFVNWTAPAGTFGNVTAATTTFTMPAQNATVTANFAVSMKIEIYDWYDLKAIGNNMSGSYLLMNDVYFTTAGYAELASPTANGGEGWQPIGNYAGADFTGIFDGQGHEIRDLFINRPGENYTGLFGYVGETGTVKDISVVNISVTGYCYVGGLVGCNNGTLDRDSYSVGSVIGERYVGGLVGYDAGSNVSDSYYNYDGCLINGENTIAVGALPGEAFDTWLAQGKFLDVNEMLSQEDGYYLINDVNDFKWLLAFGQNATLKFRLTKDLDLGDEPNFYIPYFTGEFDGNGHKISNLYINLDCVSPVGLFGHLDSGGNVTGLGVENISITGDCDVGGLMGWNGGTVSYSYSSGNVTGSSSGAGGYAVGGLVGGNGGTVSYSYSSGIVRSSYYGAGGLVGYNQGTVRSSYSSGSVTGRTIVGGLVGFNEYGTVSDSYSTGSATADRFVGGLVGWNPYGNVSNSYYNYDEVLINDENIVTIGALDDEEFKQWLANDKFLDISDRLSEEDSYYLINNVSDFKQLLAFGQNATLKFRLTKDLDLGDEPNFYICYLAGEFDGNGHKISNLYINLDLNPQLGLFAYLAPGGKVSRLGVENINITGYENIGGIVGVSEGIVSDCYSTGSVTGGKWGNYVGGLVGDNDGGTVNNSHFVGNVTGYANIGGLLARNQFGANVSNSYSSGSVTGQLFVGGLVGSNADPVSNCYSTDSVTGDYCVGGLLGWNGYCGAVSNSYSTGSVTGSNNVGGLVGYKHNDAETVSDSFWDTETSGQSISAGGIGKTTTEMQDIDTFSGAVWNIIAVALNQTNPAYIWNIVDNVTYPFLSWQPV